MNQKTFVCDAIYRGSEIVEGAVSPNKLTSLAELLLNAQQSIKGYAEICIDKLPRGERCQLQIDEERLRVSTNRRDEGFESDSESSTASGSVIEETLCASPEIKVIKDHVLRLEKLIRQDSGIHHCASKTLDDGGSNSLSSSSGAESEEEAPKRLQKFDCNPQSNTQTENPSTSEKKFQIENGNGDNFLLSDILFCHVMSHRPKVVIVVVKSLDSPIVAAHLFECLSSEAARTLYNCYYTASNKYKLNRYRINKRRNEGIAADKKAVFDRIHVSIRNIRRKSFENSSTEENNFHSEYRKNLSNNHEDINSKKIKHKPNGIQNNVNVIEIKDSQYPLVVPTGMMQKIDENGVTHIEIESAPCSLNNQSEQVRNTHLKTTFDSQEVLSALDRLSIHSSNNPDSYLNHVGVTSSCPNSLIVTSREIHAAGEREKDRKVRQRQPPLLIKKEASQKLDSLPRKENRKRGERRNRSRSDERKKRDNAQHQHSATSENLKEHSEESSKTLHVFEGGGRQTFVDILTKDEQRINFEQEVKSTERQSRIRTISRPTEEKNHPRFNHNKGPAPPPPPRKHPSNPSLMLVPTKSGQENTRAYYPKESHIVRGSSKLVRIDYPLYPPWNMNSDVNNNPKRIYYAHPSWMNSHEYHASRYNDNSLSGDIRKRSRSKSPARRPMAHRYMDVVTTFNISQKLKDLSDTVIQSWKNTSNLSGSAPALNINRENPERVMGRREKKQSNTSTSSSKSRGEDALRPVIKRGKKQEHSTDARRVTFNAYATVQMMDS